VTTNARLRALVEFADTGSIRAAAARLVVTESSVSSAISLLAAEIGVPLLARDGRGVALTAAGDRYAEYARRILGLHDEAVVAARGEADPEAGSVRIAAVTTAGEHLLPALLTSFRAAYPRATLGLEVAPRDVVWPMLTRHEVDLVVAGRPPVGPAARVRAVSANTLVVVGPPELAPGFDPATATWLMREPESGTRATTTSLLATLELRPTHMTLGSHGAVIAAAVAGLGVTLVSRQAVQSHLDAGALIELPVAGTPLHRPWHVVSQPVSTATTELFVRHLLTHPGLGWSAPGGHTAAGTG
jgi:DNA-binding transcriptional LysR family regulator